MAAAESDGDREMKGQRKGGRMKRKEPTEKQKGRDGVNESMVDS